MKINNPPKPPEKTWYDQAQETKDWSILENNLNSKQQSALVHLVCMIPSINEQIQKR